jgi:hypothetical protein
MTVLCVAACHADAAHFMQVAPFILGLFKQVISFFFSDCIFSARHEGLKYNFVNFYLCRQHLRLLF